MLLKPNQHFFPQGLSTPFYNPKEFPWELLDKMKIELQQMKFEIRCFVPPGAILENEGEIFMDEEVIIEPGAFIRGPCVLKQGVVVRCGAYIRGNVWVGKNSVVGHACELKNVLVGEESKFAHFVYAADSVIGSRVNLASRVTLSNSRLDRKEVLPMKRAKFGSVIGDEVCIGCHVVLNPGKQVEPKTIIYLEQQLITK